MTNEPGVSNEDVQSGDVSSPEHLPGVNSDVHASVHADPPRSLSSPPSLSRGFDRYTRPSAYTDSSRTPYSAAPTSRADYRTQLPPGGSSAAERSEALPVLRRRKLRWLMPWRSNRQRLSPAESQPEVFAPDFPAAGLPVAETVEGPEGGQGAVLLEDGSYGFPVLVPAPAPVAPRLWQKQPYSAIAHTLLVGAVFSMAWLFGILAAQILPGRFEQPPMQESFLRKSSRLTRRLWHFPQLWQTPTARTQIAAIPLPETGPILGPVELSPIARQPLIDELNAVETELLTLDRRLQGIEKRLGKPPYQGADVETRINALRAAIDPPVRTRVEPSYEPVALDPNDALLEVASLSITLPSDALFTPGKSDLKAAELLTQVLDQLVNYPHATISVRSYSDNQADAIASREYTLAQSLTLADYLADALPGEYRWITVGMGQSQPVVDNEDAVKRQQNRRIEILVDTR